MRKLAFSIIGVAALALLCYLALNEASRRSTSPVFDHMTKLREIALRLRMYGTDRAMAQPEALKTASIDDLVSFKIITPEDAGYLHSHHVIFHGFDPKEASEEPLFESTYPHDKPPRRIVLCHDWSVRILPLSPPK